MPDIRPCNAEWEDEPACPNPGVYRVTFDDCHASICMLFPRCLGHAVCVECAADMRRGVKWADFDQAATVRSLAGGVRRA